MGLFSLKATDASCKSRGNEKSDNGHSCVACNKKDPVIDHNHKYEPTIIDNIRRYRLQMMVHSVIYYKYNDNIISDAEWSKRAKILVELQNKYPKESRACAYYDLFKDFDGSTGFNLINEPWAINTARLLLLDKYNQNYIPEGGW